MENEIRPPSSGGNNIDSCGSQLGKRTSRPFDLPEFSWPPESTVKENGLFSVSATKVNTCESLINQSKCAKIGDQFQGDQVNYHKNIEGSKLTCSRNYQENEIEKISQYPLHMQLQSVQHEHPHWKSELPTGEMPEVLNWKTKTSYMVGQADTSRSYTKSSNLYTENFQSRPSQEDLASKNTVVATGMPLKLHNVSSGFVREVGAVEQSSSQLDPSYACFLGQNHQCSDGTRSNNPSSNEIISSGVLSSTEQKLGGRSLHNEVQTSIGSFSNCVDNLLGSRGRIHCKGDMKVKDLEAVDKEKVKSSLTDDPKNGHCPSDGVQPVDSNKSNSGSHRLDEKSRLPSRKMPLAAEKLWDGSLQLNSSITASVIAFFKSGEKLLDLNWSEFVEVKGKVKLDAFEKYIQDLPRSRNRGLMVISLCFKEGSSDKGLRGMKEVAKGYIKGERVGFAKLSEGVDLYVCPRSNAIITILAKYGFFKGMAAVEGNSELMIGCVVWRKNRAALTTVAKISDGKANALPEQPQKFPSDSSTLQGVGKVFSSVPLVENSKPSASINSFSALEKAEAADNKNVGFDSSSRNTSTTSVIKKPAPLDQKESGLSSSHCLRPEGNSLKSEASCIHQSSAEPPKERELPNAVTSLPSNASAPKTTFADCDDLPEFDFGIASRIPSRSHCSDGSIIDERLQLAGTRILDRSKQPTLPVAHSVSMSIPRSASSVSQDKPVARNVNDHGPPVSVSRQMEEKHNSKSNTVLAPDTESTYGSAIVPSGKLVKKNIFCDDDMPEWLPPDAQNEPFEKANGLPAPFPPEHSSSTSAISPPCPTGLVFPYPSSATTHNKFSSQPSPPVYHRPANSKVPPPIPSQDGPSYLTGFTFNPVLRPQSGSLAAEYSMQPADKSVRRS